MVLRHLTNSLSHNICFHKDKGSVMERSCDPAKCKTPSNWCSANKASIKGASTISLYKCIVSSFSISTMFSRFPAYVNASKFNLVLWIFFNEQSTTWDPINPAPPVINIFSFYNSFNCINYFIQDRINIC
jgi:hypothetical protein